jgi:hypothetical protein
MKGERTTPTITRMKTSSSRTMVVVVFALLAATTIITVVGTAIPIVKPAYAQLDISEQIIGEIEIPESDDIRQKVGEITTSQFLPTLPEQATALIHFRPPPALAD